MSQVQLRRLDAMCNMARFYVIDVQQDLFGGWWLVRERGRVLTTPFPDLDAAAAAHAKLWRAKIKRGYRGNQQP